MIHRKFDNLKFTRTYIGGSKQRENELFADVQGTKEDNSDVDWLEYRRMFTEYSNDVLNIVLSWKRVSRILSYVFLGVAALINFISIGVAFVLILVSITLHLAHRYFTYKERKSLSAHNFSFDIILSAIKQQTGFDFIKN